MTNMYSKQIFVLAIVFLVTMGCSEKTDSNQAIRQINDNNNKAFQTYSDAINKTSIVILALDNVLKDQITITDPIIRQANYFTNFKIYKFTALKNSKYNIIVKSQCDCLGFTKQIMKPIVTILNAQGERLDGKSLDEIVRAEPKLPSFNEGLRFVIDAHFTSLINQEIFIMISSENTDIGQDAIVFIDKKTGEPFKSILQAFKHPVGEISIEVREIR